jgi:hypothetical protein
MIYLRFVTDSLEGNSDTGKKIRNKLPSRITQLLILFTHNSPEKYTLYYLNYKDIGGKREKECHM